MTAAPDRPRRGYLPLVYRVAGINAMLLVATVVVTLVVLAPRKFSSFALDEALILIAALGLVAAANLLVLRRVVRPLEALTALARRVDLSRGGERMPGAAPTSEAGELALTFNEMLARLEAERHDATGRVLAGQEAERLRIAQELHDQVGQELTAVLLGLARVAARVTPEMRDEVTDVQETVRASLEDVRRIALELRPEALDDLGLISALAVLGERFGERAGLTVEQRVATELPELDAEAELVVYRVAQEALTNVARHAGTDRARLALDPAPGGLTLTVSDAGRGIPAGRAPGTGMRGMAERAALIGAQLDIGPGPKGGCVVTLTVQAHGAGT
ncbi:MAG TPA: histidine kinase [Solirubrobacteraceae bacterium]|nr:histidine kinase [Solirubrobacteraceae bacterium]